jgi:hypothetical protein
MVSVGAIHADWHRGPGRLIVRDYKLESLKIDETFRSLSDEVSLPKIRDVAKSFIENVSRIESLASLPSGLFYWGSMLGANREIAFFEEAGFHSKSGKSPPLDLFSKIWENAEDRTKKESEFVHGSPEWREKVWKDGVENIDRLGKIVPEWLSEAIDAVLSGVVIGAWTAFETLAGDLWEAAVNECPSPLMELGAHSGRITKMSATRRGIRPASSESGKNPSDESRQIPLNRIIEISKRTLNLSECMGSLLRPKFEFSVLASTREAYSAAFKCHSSEIDTILSDTIIDATNRLRNVIVHNAGIADIRYTEGIIGTPAPIVDSEKKVELDGKIAQVLINPMITLCGRLLKAVDAWVQDERDGKHIPK